MKAIDRRRSVSGRNSGRSYRRFHRHGHPEFEAKRYEGHLKKGGILLSCIPGSFLYGFEDGMTAWLPLRIQWAEPRCTSWRLITSFD
jgi:hypothetical protein